LLAKEGVMTTQQPLMDLLAEHVPVTLLLDLFAPPKADEVYATEGGSADWLAAVRVGAA
jgi:hypothetical protein